MNKTFVKLEVSPYNLSIYLVNNGYELNSHMLDFQQIARYCSWIKIITLQAYAYVSN